MKNYLHTAPTSSKKLVRPRQWDKTNKVWKPSWDVIEFASYAYTAENIEVVTALLQDNLTPDLLSPAYLEGNETNPLYGHCVHASQAMMCLMDTTNLVPIRGQDVSGEYHWWLADTETGQIIDPTEGQFDALDYPAPHSTGKKTNWYTFKSTPKKQTLSLIKKMQPDAKLYWVSDPYGNYGTLETFM